MSGHDSEGPHLFDELAAMGITTIDVTFMPHDPERDPPPGTIYVLVCRSCAEVDPVAIPFETAEARGKWATAHRGAVGHNRWYVKDYTPGSPQEDDREEPVP